MRVVSLLLLSVLLVGCTVQPLYQRADVVFVFPVPSLYGMWPGLLPEPMQPGEYEVWVAVRFEALRAGNHTLTIQVERDGRPVEGATMTHEWEHAGKPVQYVLLPVQTRWEPGVYVFRVRLDGRKTVGVLQFHVAEPSDGGPEQSPEAN